MAPPARGSAYPRRDAGIIGPLLENTMSRDRGRPNQMRARIAAAAARLMAEDGIDDFALAKRKAARQLGATDTQSMPANDEIEAELRAYHSLYQADEQRDRIQALREIALDAMRALAPFKPYLSGPVLKGTAGRYADVDLQLFSDDHKAVELYLLNRTVPYESAVARHYCGDEPRAVTVLRLDWEGVPLTLSLYAANDERAALKTSPAGRPIERAALAAVEALVGEDA
jgi:hypothetical protein